MREGNFCVIGEQAWNRTWLGSQDEAVRHAGVLLAKHKPNGVRCDAVAELYVVEVRRVVRLAAPPIEELPATYGLRGCGDGPHD